MARRYLSAIALIGAVSLGSSSSSHNHELCNFLPENDQWIPVEQMQSTFGGISEAQFNGVIDRFEALYKGEVEANGDQLVINRLWEDGTVNASAERSGKSVIVNMYGGLARHEAITQDGFALVLCHEMGHHLGGAPKVKNWRMKWATNEGQADYFATLKCLRRVFANDDNEKIMASEDVPQAVQSACSTQFIERSEQLICMRGAMAGYSVSSMFLSFGRQGANVDFTTPDPKQVRKTFNAHPKAQCRLDTYYAGAVCDVATSVSVSTTDIKAGTCWDPNVSKMGLRPRCWFQPKPTWWERVRDRWSKQGTASDQATEQQNDQYEDSLNDGIIH